MRTVRVGTIVWGAILLVFAVVVFSIAVFDLRVFQAATVTWVLIGLGGVLVLAALIAAIARAVSGGMPEGVTHDSTTEAPAPEPEVATAAPEPRVPAKARTSTKKPTTEGQPVD